MSTDVAERISAAIDEFLGGLASDEHRVISIVLRAHLHIEQVLSEAIGLFATNLASVEDAKLTFTQKVHLVRAFNLRHPSEPFWSALRALNALRNDLAHELTSAQRERKVAEFIRLTEADFPEHPNGAEWAKAATVEDQLVSCLSYVYGALKWICQDYEARARLMHANNKRLLAKAK